MDVSLLRVTNG